MSKLLISLLILFFLLLVGVSYLVFALNNNNASFKTPFSPIPTPPSIAIRSLTLSPENTTVLNGQTNIIHIIYASQNNTGNKPRLIQLEIAYDPTALSEVTMTPGDFFTNPTILLETINTHSGRISYVLEETASTANAAQASAVGTVAVLSFTPNPTFLEAETALSFLGKTMIRAATNDNILTATYGTKLFFTYLSKPE